MDNVARFSDAKTILLAEVTAAEAKRGPIYAESRRRLEENYNILRATKDQDGQPFRIIRVPCPDLMLDTMTAGDPVYDFMRMLKFRDGRSVPKVARVSLAGSYLNFFVSNGTVVCSKFGDSYASNVKKDGQVAQILTKAFPGRKVVMIDTTAVNLGGGGIHCITQPMPRSTW